MIDLGVRSARAASLALIVVALAGCSSSARLDQFNRFAQAGVTYTEGVDLLLDASFKTSVEADNAVLVQARELIGDPDSRLEALNEHDTLAQQRLVLHQEILGQTELLENYFLAIAALASTESGQGSDAAGLGQSARNFATELGGLSEKVANAQIGEQKVADFVGDVVPIAVAAHQRALLDSVLEETAPGVGRSIEVHGAALQAIKAQMLADQELLSEERRTRTIAQPYMASGALPSDWGQRRLGWLQEAVTIAELDQAIDAAGKLELAFVALVENRVDGASFELLLQDVERLVVVAERLTQSQSQQG